MFPSFEESTLAQAQVVAITRLMLYVAHVDGEKTPEEVALIRQFYEGCAMDASSGEVWMDFSSLLQAACSPDISPDELPEIGQKEVALAFCLMTAWADGHFSEEEMAATECIARKLGMSDVLPSIAAQVKDQMLAQFARLPDVDSVVKVARELG